MALRKIFLGKPLHWLPWPLLGVLFVWMNKVHLHVTRFNTFTFVLLGLSAGVVAFFLLTTRRGEQVTREPIPELGSAQGTGSED
ncbi:MAG: hypothetical protein P8Y76_06455 [bacterium]|jgi:hypothetical protein